QAFGHTVLAWIWLQVALCAQSGATATSDEGALRLGKLSACRYFYRYELPRIAAWLKVVESRDDTCRLMDEAWF
ncbi:MAG: acyl-CoA dehydrogenase C-terminal domain-containing protein, partial [Rhizobacter sp.]|nr:acyl-CoA dehydrogenase C-terminal domain-containing protein [Rhizobacter sp.]